MNTIEFLFRYKLSQIDEIHYRKWAYYLIENGYDSENIIKLAVSTDLH